MELGSESMLRAREYIENGLVTSLEKRNYKGMDEKKIKETSQEFESLFIEQLFKSMRNTVPKDEWLNGGLKQDIFEDMLYSEYSKLISRSGGIGLGDMVYKFLLSNR
jgi:flagellar protein FlgJ